MRDKAKMDLDFRTRLLEYMENIASECLPEYIDDGCTIFDGDIPDIDDELLAANGSRERIFLPFLDPDDPDFDNVMMKTCLSYCPSTTDSLTQA
jgi:hypothetical protein